MIVNRAAISALFVNLKATFNNAFQAAPTTWERIAMKVPSTTAGEDYVWLSNFPRMRRWIGEKFIRSLKAFKYSIVNEDWEATVEVDRNDIEDDRLGIYRPQAEAAGVSAKQLPDEIVGEVVAGVFTKPCFDGQYFCDTDHPVIVDGKETSASNKSTAALSIATQAAAMASFGAARTAMRKLKDDEGRPLNVNPNILLVATNIEDTAKALMTTDRLEDGKPNLYKGACEVVVSPWLPDNAWLLLDTTKPVKPFIYQERKKPEFVSQTSMENDQVFMQKKFRFGAEARAAGGYGFWQLCHGSTGQG